jgi:PAP2 superfamily
MRLFALLSLIIFPAIYSTAQEPYQRYVDKIPPLKSKALKKSLAIPATLILVGIYTITDNDIINQYEINEERNEWMPKFHHRADDYLQYVPIAAVYGLNLMGIEGKNNFGNRTALLIKTELIVATLTFSLKKITAVPRPDTYQPTSFPSGHTAQAFAAATFMHKEYGSRNIWYSVGAYSIASCIGVMRVLNNRHWTSDVLVGAGIGILSTNLAYLTHQYKWGKRNRHVTVLPTWHGDGGGVSLTYRFK